MIKKIDWKKLVLSQQKDILVRPFRSNKASLTLDVKSILDEVKQKKDQALFEFTQRFDKVKLSSIEVSALEIQKSYSLVSQDQITLVKNTIARISNYHRLTAPKDIICDTNDGVLCKKIYRPIRKVGLYVPGGSAPLISTLMMLVTPAKAAGCKEIYVASPCDKNGNIHPLILVVADICKVSKVYKLGGAQAIAALAYGTQTVSKVDKIYGPGNSWVTQAKQQVSNDSQGAAIDLPAGPSEVLVIADTSANPKFVAADLLAQAEHGIDSQALLLTDSQKLANDVEKEVIQQTSFSARKTIIEKALANSSIIVTRSIDESITIANDYAPEHLILNVANAEKYIDNIQNAGAVFVGPWAAEALGDYITGSNHVLPTYGYARAYSGLATIDFMKAISVQNVSKQGIKNLGKLAMQLADIEGLKAHQNSIAIRLESL